MRPPLVSRHIWRPKASRSPAKWRKRKSLPLDSSRCLCVNTSMSALLWAGAMRRSSLNAAAASSYRFASVIPIPTKVSKAVFRCSPSRFDGLHQTRYETHHGFLLKQMLDHVEAQEADIAALDERIEAALAPFVAQLELLTTIPGVDRRSAQVILAEIDPDMYVFPTAAHLASWAGMCPGQRDSAGKHGSGKTRKGSKWLRGTLVQSARGASGSKGTYLSERYRQVMRRRGDANAIVAAGHEILLAAYRVLATAQPDTDPGPTTLNRLTAQRLTRQAVRRLQDLGYQVTIEPRTDAA